MTLVVCPSTTIEKRRDDLTGGLAEAAKANTKTMRLISSVNTKHLGHNLSAVVKKTHGYWAGEENRTRVSSRRLQENQSQRREKNWLSAVNDFIAIKNSA
jgi:hypothetical protein